MNEVQAGAYLAAMIDGEGSVDVTRDRCVRIANTEQSIIEAIQACCAVLGIDYNVQIRHRDGYAPVTIIGIYGKDQLTKLLELPIQSAKKKAKLEQAIVSFKRATYIRKRNQPSKRQIASMIQAGMTQREMAVALGMKSHANVQYYIDKYRREAVK